MSTLDFLRRLKNHERVRPSMTPDTPDALVEAATHTSLHILYPEYDELNHRQQKLLRLLHVELASGQLNDAALIDTLLMVTRVWRRFSDVAHVHLEESVAESPTFNSEWLSHFEHFAAVSQYLRSVELAIHSYPNNADLSPTECAYGIRFSEDDA